MPGEVVEQEHIPGRIACAKARGRRHMNLRNGEVARWVEVP
jgi:hypothetical protein